MDAKPIFEFADAVSSSMQSRLRNLLREREKQAKRLECGSLADEIVTTYFEDEMGFLEATSETGSYFAVVALYAHLEVHTKNMCKIAIRAAPTSQLFKWIALKRMLQSEGIRMERLAGYKEVNQLRCLNNSIKHGWVVSRELASTGWGKDGSGIDANKCAEQLQPYAYSCEVYLDDLRSRLAKVIDQLPDAAVSEMLKS
jgi:hypothetical protein